jgi:hypothetical protein
MKRGNLLSDIKFEIRIIPAGTGSAVWDDPRPSHVVDNFMPATRQHGPMLGVLFLGSARPTPGVLQDVVVRIGEDVRAGRYGEFSFVVTSQDGATRNIISHIASSQDLAIFITPTLGELESADPAGALTTKDRETLNFVLKAGGTVTASEFAEQLSVEQTTAGNRLVALHKKGFLQRIARPHPSGDQFIDPRSVRLNGA